MGIMEAPAEMPDTYGIAEYFISHVATEIDGGNVRVICGVKRGGHMHWLCSFVMSAGLLVTASHQLEQAACDASSLQEMIEARPRGH